MNILSRSCLLSASLLAASLPAQTAAAPTTPAPQILIDTVGPDGWRVRFGPTNLGSLLESEQGRGLWQPHMLPMLDHWKRSAGDQAFRAVHDALFGYGGRIRIGVWIDASGFDRPDLLKAAIVLEGDGRTDLAVLAAEIRRLQANLEGEWQDTDLGGTKVAVRTNGADAITAPIAEGSNLLIAVGRKDTLAAALAGAKSLASSATGTPPVPNTPALQLHVDTRALVAMAKAATPDDSEWPLMEVLGLDSLGSTTFSIGTAGPRVQFELQQAFLGEERGLFAALFPTTQGVPSLLRLRPKHGSWKVGRFDLQALYTTIERALESRTVGQENVREEIKKELGIDLAADLLAHTTDEALLFVTPPSDPEELPKTPWAFVIRLADQAAFRKGFDIAMGNAKPMLSREETVAHADGELRRYGNMLGYDLWFAVGQGLFAIAGGDGTEDRLKALLDSVKALPAPTENTADPEFATLQRALPPGVNGLGRGDIDSIVGLPIGWWMMGLGEFLPGLVGPGAPDEEQQEQVRALLKQHQLDTIRTASGQAEQTWRWRLFW